MTEVVVQSGAREHLWLHFTRMDGYRGAEVPMIVCITSATSSRLRADAGTRRPRDDERRGKDGKVQRTPAQIAGPETRKPETELFRLRG